MSAENISYDLKRFAGIKRDYTEDDVERLRGSIKIEYSMCKMQSQKLLNEQQMEYNKKFIQKTVQVLIDGAGKHEGQVKGKSEFNQSVALQGEKQIIGQIIPVQIKEVLTHSLLGERA